MKLAEPAETAGDGPVSPTVAGAVEDMIGALQHTPRHAALVRLARVYAAEIDAGDVETLAKLGPRLESVCVRLGVTPAKAAGGEHGGGTSSLVAFRARRSG